MSKEYNENAKKKPDGKNKIIFILLVVIAVLLAVITAIVIIVNATKDKDSNEKNTNETTSVTVTDASGGSGSQGGSTPSQQGGQQPSVPSQGNAPQNEDVAFIQGSALSSLDQKKKDEFITYCADYGIDSETAKSLVNDSKWTTFEVMVKVTNTNGKGIAAKDIKADNTAGIKVSQPLGVEYGIPSGKSQYIFISGIADSSEYGTQDAIISALGGMNIRLCYTFLDNPSESVEDWSKVEIKYMPIKF